MMIRTSYSLDGLSWQMPLETIRHFRAVSKRVKTPRSHKRYFITSTYFDLLLSLFVIQVLLLNKRIVDNVVVNIPRSNVLCYSYTKGIVYSHMELCTRCRIIVQRLYTSPNKAQRVIYKHCQCATYSDEYMDYFNAKAHGYNYSRYLDNMRLVVSNSFSFWADYEIDEVFINEK